MISYQKPVLNIKKRIIEKYITLENNLSRRDMTKYMNILEVLFALMPCNDDGQEIEKTFLKLSSELFKR